jgi:mono/diheme cytochrome c family protein
MVKRLVLWAGLVVMVLLAACGNDDSDTTTQPPSTTQAATTTTPAATVGDPERGRQIWEDGGGVIGAPGCSECHSLDGTEKTVPPALSAPSWQGISGRAGDRVPGLSAEEYLRESIVDPAAYIVDGYSDFMPKGFRFLLSEEDVDGLVAFLLTL